MYINTSKRLALWGGTALALFSMSAIANAKTLHHTAHPAPTHAEATKTYDVTIRLSERGTREPLIMATCVIGSINAHAITDYNGVAVMKNIPAGRYTVRIQYVGFETIERTIQVDRDLDMPIMMTASTLALKEVTVTAKRKIGEAGTVTTIGRQALDHLQAMSLADAIQLIPGQLMSNTDLTTASNIQLRTVSNNSNVAFGTSIVLDGVALSNNARPMQGTYSGTNTAGVSTDLRSISADNIESIEVVRGIPSAEYGDLNSGLVIVNSKVGRTPLQVRAKINPTTMNYSASKGVQLNNNGGVLNFNADYAKAWSDPRTKTRSYTRYTGGVAYSKDITRRWNTTTRLRFVLSRSWNGNDPDAIQDGTFEKNNAYTLGFTHNGRIRMNKKFSRTLNYTVGLNYNQSKARRSIIVSNASGFLPILTALETGYHEVPYYTTSYSASGGTESSPGNFVAKVDNDFGIKAGNTYQGFKMGISYNYDWNSGKGYYNDDDSYPLTPNNNGRPRPYSDIPGIHQIAAYVSDDFRWDLGRHSSLKVQAGLRFTAAQPWKEERTFALSPRINAAYKMNRFVTWRGGIGWNSKAPGMAQLYPDKKYTDILTARHISSSDPTTNYLLYYTHVYNTAYSPNMKNATTRKIELGVDFTLPQGRALSIVAYHDRTPNGFEVISDYTTFNYSTFTAAQGLNITPGSATTVDYTNPAGTYQYLLSKGTVGNTAVSVNRGIEVTMDLGKIDAIKTDFSLSGAFAESKTYSDDYSITSPVQSSYAYDEYGTRVVPLRLVYAGGKANSMSIYRQFSSQLHTTTHIPALRMVLTLDAQAIWQSYSKSLNPLRYPIAYFTSDPSQWTMITEAMLADPTTTLGGTSVLLSDQKQGGTENSTRTPITWNLRARLTKEFGQVGGISFYANNVLYYEPFLSSSSTTTLSQRNTSSYHFGFELFFKL